MENSIPLQVLYAVEIKSDKDVSLIRALIRKFGWRPMFLDDAILEMSVTVGRIIYFRLSAMEFFTASASTLNYSAAVELYTPTTFLRIVKENASLIHTLNGKF